MKSLFRCCIKLLEKQTDQLIKYEAHVDVMPAHASVGLYTHALCDIQSRYCCEHYLRVVEARMEAGVGLASVQE